MAFRKGAIVVLLLAFLCCLDAQTTNTTEPVGTATHLSYKIINRFSHDPSAFTQGLIVQPGNSRYFIEGTGQYRMSQMRRVEIDTGKVVEFYALDSRKFGEGVTFLNGFYYQLTWKSGVVYIYRQVDDMDSDGMLEEQALEFGEPEEIGLLPNPIKQGWGLTTDGEYLILSDGSSTLYWLSEDFEVVKELKVRDEFGKLLPRLNELEFIEGEIWANVWFSTWIYIINPESGKVVKMANLEALESGPRSDVLNGIAYDSTSKRTFITGKLWSYVYEIELVNQDDIIEKPEEGGGTDSGVGRVGVVWGLVLVGLVVGFW